MVLDHDRSGSLLLIIGTSVRRIVLLLPLTENDLNWMGEIQVSLDLFGEPNCLFFLSHSRVF